jgi:hypothetical protein
LSLRYEIDVKKQDYGFVDVAHIHVLFWLRMRLVREKQGFSFGF